MTSIEFADVARRLADASRAAGQEPPAFRSPPRAKGMHRSIRRRGSGNGATTTVAVTVRHRPMPAVIADMIDGVIAANRLTGADAGRVRDLLWVSISGVLAGHATAEPQDRIARAVAPVHPIRAA